MTPIDHVLNRLSTCLKRCRGSPVKHCREMTDASKGVIRGKRVEENVASIIQSLTILRDDKTLYYTTEIFQHSYFHPN